MDQWRAKSQVKLTVKARLDRFNAIQPEVSCDASGHSKPVSRSQ
jgi:hypothetical protein